VSEPVATAVYRFFDAKGGLLYIGSSGNPDQRMSGHRSNSPWFVKVDSRTDDWYPDQAAAFEAEKQAIRDENPPYNRMNYTPTLIADPATTFRCSVDVLAEIDRMATAEERDRSSMIRLLLKEAVASRQQRGMVR
jgi:hypothetical protein